MGALSPSPVRPHPSPDHADLWVRLVSLPVPVPRFTVPCTRSWNLTVVLVCTHDHLEHTSGIAAILIDYLRHPHLTTTVTMSRKP